MPSEIGTDVNAHRRTASSPRSFNASNVTGPGQRETVRVELNTTSGMSESPKTETTSNNTKDSWGGIGVPRRSSRSSFLSTSQRDTVTKDCVKIEESSPKYSEKEHIKISSNIQHDRAKSTDTEESVDTSWAGINVPRRTSSFRSSYTSNSSSSKDPNTETIPHESRMSEIHQVEESSRSYAPIRPRRSGSSSNVAFKGEVENAHASPERITRRGVKRSKICEMVQLKITTKKCLRSYSHYKKSQSQQGRFT